MYTGFEIGDVITDRRGAGVVAVVVGKSIEGVQLFYLKDGHGRAFRGIQPNPVTSYFPWRSFRNGWEIVTMENCRLEK